MTYEEMLAQPKPLILYNISPDIDEGSIYIIKEMNNELYYWVYGKSSGIYRWSWFRFYDSYWSSQKWDTDTTMEMPSTMTVDDLRGALRTIWTIRLK